MAMPEAERKARLRASQRKYAHTKKGRLARQRTVWKSHTKSFFLKFNPTVEDVESWKMSLTELKKIRTLFDQAIKRQAIKRKENKLKK